MKYDKLAVNHTTDPKTIEKTIHGLKLVAKMGRLAQKTLDQIERDGYAEGIAPGFSHKDWNRDFVIKPFTFYKSIQPTREMAPDFADLSISLGPMNKGYHGGTEFRTSEITISGTGVVQAKKEVIKRHISATIGKLRFKSNGTLTTDIRGVVSSLYTDAKWIEKDKGKAAKIMANAIAENFFILLNEKGERSFDITGMTQVVRDLKHLSTEWLVNEGHILRLCRDIKESSRILEVIES